jgi:hypothetical protein
MAEGADWAQIRQDPDGPGLDELYDWLRTRPGFGRRWLAARERSQGALLARMKTLAEAASGDAAQTKLQIEVLNWRLERLEMPGDRGLEEPVIVTRVRFGRGK